MSSFTLPDFETRESYPFQVLPDGVHVSDEPAYHRRFVEEFPDSSVRATICDGFFRLRRDAWSQGLIAVQWVDGSFVESKLDPGDIDLVSFIDYDFLNALAPTVQAFVERVLSAGEATKPTYQTHTFLVAACEPAHVYYPIFEQARAYWRKWFGQTREDPLRVGQRLPSVPKGIVAMYLGDPQLAPAVSTQR